MTVRNAETMPAGLSEWQARGYHGAGGYGYVNAIAGRPAIICGNAAGVFEQARRASAELPDAVVFGVNDAGMYLPVLDHWVSLHQDKAFIWSLMRSITINTNRPYTFHSVDARQGVTAVWDKLTPCFALSGYFAMQLAWIMGASPIILCGCPGEPAPRFFEAEPRQDFTYADKGIQQQLIKEMSRVPGFKDAVRSMSGGFTESYFGRP